MWESFYSRTLTPSAAVMHKVKIHFFLYFFVRPSFGRQFVIGVDGCCANCVVGLAFLPSGHTTRKQRHYDVRNDAITTSWSLRLKILPGQQLPLFPPPPPPPLHNKLRQYSVMWSSWTISYWKDERVDNNEIEFLYFSMLQFMSWTSEIKDVIKFVCSLQLCLR